jgi:DNA invertase Pin-like site-specific DNA recombinase
LALVIGERFMLIGYVRVSTQEQHVDLQIDALTKVGCTKIFQDTTGGAAVERKGLNEALSYAREGDTLVVWRLDRLGRSLGSLIEFTNMLKSRKIGFRSVTDTIDTTTSTGQFFFHVTGAFAELERNLIRERTMAGLEAARARGRHGGRPRALDDEGCAMAHELYRANKNSVSAIARRLGVAKRTLYRYLEQSRSQELQHSSNNFS